MRTECEPFSIEGWIALALSAVDAYASHHQDPPFQAQAEENMADALSTLGETATDVLHFMDGKVKTVDLYNRAVRIAATDIWGPIPCESEGIAEEEANAAALLAALSLACAAMWDDTNSVEMLDAAYHRFTVEAEETRLVFARRVRQLVESDGAADLTRRQLR
ncbi:hypothetical protein AQJ46_47855 [Streptomyces canus]|uniref:Uncharacterized protein n=2 Tax=Streptomyces canus TaxID=58343 RepID=A0A117QW43_9ACTN|nr:hypothetical protein AQJ46_47855 [Streptomyces canus]